MPAVLFRPRDFYRTKRTERTYCFYLSWPLRLNVIRVQKVVGQACGPSQGGAGVGHVPLLQPGCVQWAEHVRGPAQ